MENEQPAQEDLTSTQIDDLVHAYKKALPLYAKLDINQRFQLEAIWQQRIIASRLGWLLAIIVIIVALQILASCGLRLG
jgi:hypothetical protein